MRIFIDRKSNLFDEGLTDEINKSFESVNAKIQEYEPIDLEYKLPVSYRNDWSFSVGNIFCIRTEIEITQDYERFTDIKELDLSIPFDVWTVGYTKTGENVWIHIRNKELSVYGVMTEYPQTVYVNEDIVLPSYAT